MSKHQLFEYHAFGLDIRSEIQLPELSASFANPGQSVGVIDVRYGPVPENLENPKASGVLFQAADGVFLLKMDSIARYMASNGNEIIVEPLPSSGEKDIRLFLLGSVFGALLHQRGALALHSSGIVTSHGDEKKAVLFAGNSGIGKSTLAAALHQRGYPLLGDDKIAVLEKDHRLFAYPGLAHLRLWKDSAKKLVIGTDRLEKSRDSLEKYNLPTNQSFHETAVPLGSVYLLHSHNKNTFELTTRSGMGKFQALLKNTFRKQFLTGLGMSPLHFQLASAVATYVRVLDVWRPMYPFQLDELVDLILKDVKENG